MSIDSSITLIQVGKKAGMQRNAPAAHMHKDLSRDGTPPQELLATGRAEIIRYEETLRAVAAFRTQGQSSPV